MAATYRFYKIGDANAEIEKLTKERDDLKSRAEAAESNADEIAKQAEASKDASKSIADITKERDDWKAKHDAEVKAHSETKAGLEKAQTELAGVPEKIKIEASKQAQQIFASLGQPPIQTAPSAAPAAPQKTDISQLKGLAKVRAAFEAQAAAKTLNAK